MRALRRASCLRSKQIQELATDDGPLQLSLFDDRDLAEISAPQFPDERLIVCRNPDLARLALVDARQNG